MAIDALGKTQQTSSVKNTSNVHKAAKSSTTVPVGQKRDSAVPEAPKGLPTVKCTIQEGYRLATIAKETGLSEAEIITQLKYQGKLPADYNFNEIHSKDPACMKIGTELKFMKPKTDVQKAEYNEWLGAARKVYQKATKARIAMKEKQAKEAEYYNIQHQNQPQKNFIQRLFGL